MEVFRVSELPDVGGFSDGDRAGLAWDILKRTAAHYVPSVIDLTDCPHLKPYAIACICSLGILGKQNGKEVTLRLPSDAECCAHLCRLGVPRWFRCDSVPEVETRETNLSVEHVTWPPAQASERIIDMLAPQAGLSPGVSPNMKASLDEIIMNALTHAESPIDCVVAGQSFPKTGKVEVAVLDLGQTILKHLKQHPKHTHLSSDREAILLAMQDGITGTPPGKMNRRGNPNSGAGLDYVRKYCEQVGGEITVLSGDRWATYNGGIQPIIGRLNVRFSGCLVNMRFLTNSPLQLEAIEPIL